MADVIVLGFFSEQNQALTAAGELGRRGFQRTGQVHKNHAGTIEIRDPFRRRRLFAVALFALAGGSLAALALAVLRPRSPALAGVLPGLALVLVGALSGWALAELWAQRSRFGLDRELFADHARWLAPDETVLILQVPPDSLAEAVEVMREGVEVPPIIFFLHPKRELEMPRPRPAGSTLTLPEIEEHARRLAQDQRLDAGLRPSPEVLRRVEAARRWVHHICQDLSLAGRLEETTSPAAEWLLDNEYVVESNARDVQLNLPQRYFRQLPVLAVSGLPRIYSLADELVSHTELRIDNEPIEGFLEAYQAAHPLTIGELWAFPQMLRIALIEGIAQLAVRALSDLRQREQADFWANRLMTVSRRDPNQLFGMMAELTQAHPSPSPYFASQLVGHLYDEEEALAPVQSWLERTYHRPLGELNLREQTRQTQDQISISNAFASLRQLALIDWRQVFENLSHVERTLRSDPAGVYAGMDFDTRDQYRRAVERLARGCQASEVEVARRAVARAAQASIGGMDEPPLAHVGAHLIGEAARSFASALGSPPAGRIRLLDWVRAHPSLVYFFSAGLMMLAFLAMFIAAGLQDMPWAIVAGITLLALFPVSQLALKIADYFVTRLLPPTNLPKMGFLRVGIPETCRTLVVVPEMLASPEQIRLNVEKLEVRFLANQDANLYFSLFTDYTDSETPHRDDDDGLLQTAVEGIEALNLRYPWAHFFLLHRDRRWSETEQKYIGWERKRGKLEELNGLIDGTRPLDAPNLVVVGEAERLADVRFIITLDSDTQLPTGTARRMIETLAHPLNRARFDPGGRHAAGFSIIQPRVTASLPSTTATPFTRIFTDAVGIDPYTKAVSDVGQDLFGEGSYHGKGIYEVRAFSRVLSGRFPQESLLSHDLIEGAHVGVGLASDIELLDEFPPDYLTYTNREHRWVRGDWQIASWATPRVPRADGSRGPNVLSGFNRWKIFDNLRRSLVPAASVALLVAAWLLSPRLALASGVLLLALLLFQSLLQPVTWLTTRRGWRHFSLGKISHDLVRATIEASLLMHQSGLALDAILRVAYRRLVSRRNLLQWTSVQAMSWSAPGQLRAFVLSMGLASLVSGAAALAVYQWQPDSLPLAAPWLLLWFLSPALGWALNHRPSHREATASLPDSDRQFLRTVARRTWRYFSHFVNEESHWLPPDNYQVSHREQVAMRTSPTNIGLWMLGNLAAHDFGFLTVDQVVANLQRTMATIDQLERYEGHLLNWYDIQSLAPLEPRYVSAVDSGNLLGALWCLRQGLDELLARPLLERSALEGLVDTLRLVLEDERPSPTLTDWSRLLETHRTSPRGAADTLGILRQVGEALHGNMNSGTAAASTEWRQEFERQVAAWLELGDRYLAWCEILWEKSDGELSALGPEVTTALQPLHTSFPSLRELAAGEIPGLMALRDWREQLTPEAETLLPWIDRVLEAFDRSKWLAGEMLAAGERLIEEVGLLAYGINMRFLYDPTRRLFAVGFNASAGRLDRAYYDLLASEARLGSFVAIAGGTVPIEHWFAMSRPYNAIGRRRVLLSWTGTMFEYLMPLLIQRTYRNSLLDQAVQHAVAVQVAYGKQRHVPWGVSECAYGDLDSSRTYQYKAFGVPALGLKRDLAQDLVVAPYASMLALSLAPRETVANLQRMAGMGLLADFGFYEAMDFSRRPRRRGERGVVVRAFMAHHQGMSLLALANYLQDDPFPRRFHAEPRVKAMESLLYERVPTLPPVHHISTRERQATVESVAAVEPSVSKFDTPNTPTPKTQLLSNGRYSLMVTTAGGGYSRWGEVELTRWRSDTTCDAWGTFCYLRDRQSGERWANTYHPVGGKFEGYQADFALDRATFRRNDWGIATETEIVVSPEDDVEIRRLTLINRSGRRRLIDLTSYVELSMAPHNADRQHPAFNKLFIQTEAVLERQALLAFRRPRSEQDPPIFVGHRLTGALRQEDDGLRFETDRRPFIGRGRSLANPMALERPPAQTQGYVLDPILSLRTTLSLAPHERAQVSLIVAAGDSRQKVLQLVDKYGDPQVIERAMDLAWASAQLELRVLRIQPDDARRYQKLAGQLLYPSAAFRPGAERSEERNRKGQSGLWAYGISGDLPIVLVTIGEVRDVQLVRQVLQAHTYWRTHGLMADLLILNEESSSYEQPLRERLESLIRLHAMYTGVDKPGGVFLRSGDQIPEEDVRLLMAASSAILVAARGTLPQQLGVAIEAPDVPKLLGAKRGPREPSAPLPFLDLPYFNSLGGFTGDGREYAIYLGPGTNTPAPWVNVIANPTFGTVVSETGAGFTWYGNSQRNRLTPWSNDPVLDSPSEAIYLRDEETGEFWTPTASPIRESTAYRARHGAGYTVFEHNSHGIEQELTVVVPVDDQGGKPLKLQRLRLRNDSGRPRRLSITSYAEWALGETRDATQMHTVSQWDEEVEALLARNRFHPEYGDRVAFAAMSRPVDSYSADRTTFLGRNRSLANPAAMERVASSKRTGAGLDPCAALRTSLDLAPGETAQVIFLLGQAESSEEVRQLVSTYRDPVAFELTLDSTRAWWDNILGTIQVHTPEQSLDFLVNRWLLYQTLSCRLWARSAFYQSGGAYGFRDQLQDVLGLVYAQPDLARQHILLAASRQFREGDVQHWWHAPSGTGIRSRISDDLLWLPYAVAHYVRLTEDESILQAPVTFLDGPRLADGQLDLFGTPEVSHERASLFEHCQRAVQHGLTSGPNGLPLIGTGDWNDGMDRVGAEGKGESIWLGWFLVDVLEGMAELAEIVGSPESAESYRKRRAELLQRIDAAGWDGSWYLRATFDEGTPVGSAANRESRIDLLPQAWASISGGGDPERAVQALEAAGKHLVRREENLVLLFDPPFDKHAPSPGYIQGYPPGIRENGGQYTHAAVWLAIAHARRGQGGRAGEILRMLNPIEHARDVASAWRYTVEPYVMAADVYRAPGRTGQGGWSWYTGAAAWMYRAWVEELLGLKLRGESLWMDPVIPNGWPGFDLTYRHGEAVYEIHVDNAAGVERGVVAVEMDGRPLPDGVIPLERELVKHRVTVRMGPGLEA